MTFGGISRPNFGHRLCGGAKLKGLKVCIYLKGNYLEEHLCIFWGQCFRLVRLQPLSISPGVLEQNGEGNIFKTFERVCCFYDRL